ncbi:hypothetical protein [Actinomadura sp. 9N215]|uniref:hypothetical protein n=1 Tax=Actinomadura sp. 9N215 TaxID=3375150 RepID=UPI0037B8AFBA
MPVTAESRVELHPLQFRDEGGGQWIVGRADIGEFVEVPAEAATFLRALGGGTDLDGARDRVRGAHGEDIDAVSFVDDLVDLGFVARLDGVAIGEPPRPPSLRRLRPEHVRWVFRWPVLVGVYAFVLAGLAASARRGDLFPSFHVYFITGSQSVNLAWNTAMVLTAIAIHEFWHLAAARVDGVHARFGLGTRLQVLVAQTTVAGLWGASRRARFRVYLAGVTSDLVIIAGCSLAVEVFAPSGFALRSLQALSLSLLLSIAQQFALYMRTDMYFVLQESLRCKNLYADGWRYVRYVTRRTAAALFDRQAPANPLHDVPSHERRPVKVYSWLMVLGSFVSVALFLYYQGPILVYLFAKAGEHAVDGTASGNVAKIADGITVFAIEGTLQVLFVRLFIVKHAPKLRAAFGFFRVLAVRR